MPSKSSVGFASAVAGLSPARHVEKIRWKVGIQTQLDDWCRIRTSASKELEMVDQARMAWNQIVKWLRWVGALKQG
jgi:hypothetical protein